MSRRFLRGSRVSSTDFERSLIIDKEFEIIEKFFWIPGIIFTRSRNLCSIQRFLIVCLDVIFTMFYIYITIASFYSAATGSAYSSGYAFINAFSNFSGICIRFVVLIKRRHIKKCIDVISKLDNDILGRKETKSLKKFLYGCFIGAIILPLSQMTLGIITDERNKYETLYLFGIFLEKTLKPWIRIAVIIIRTASVLLCRSVPFFAIILCSFVFTRLRNINQNFMIRLKMNLDMSSPSKLFNDFTFFYGRITKAVEQVEKALSLISFFIYGYILSCIFSVTSFLVTKPPEPTYFSPVLYQIITLVGVVTCFIILSMRAASVNESSVEVKDLIYALPSKEFDFDPNLTATLLQLANNFANEVCMTGWGLFVINRSFILTTAGVVVSYGVILVQLGKT